MGSWTDQSWVPLVLVAMLLGSTSMLWLRLSKASSLRPWLVRHTVGNGILAIGVSAAWFFNLASSYYLLIACGVIFMWIWGNRKLRSAMKQTSN